LVTDTVPVVPPLTTAVIVLGLTTVNVLAAVPPKLTAVVPVKFEPVIVTVWPLPASAGLMAVIMGAAAGDMLKVAELVTEPPGAVTVILPVDPVATTAVMVVAFTTA
jgi:hypothetical protein